MADGSLLDEALAKKIGILQQIPLFRKCRDSLLFRIATKLRRSFALPGEVLSRAGDPCVHILLLEEGQIHLWGEGEETVGLEDGGVVGDPRILLQQREELWQHNSIARSSCQLLALTCEHMVQVAESLQKATDRRRISEVLAFEMENEFSDEEKRLRSELLKTQDSYKSSGLRRVAQKALRVVQFVKSMNSTGQSSAPGDSEIGLKQIRELRGKKQKSKDGDKEKKKPKEEESKGGSREALTFNTEEQKQDIRKQNQTTCICSTYIYIHTHIYMNPSQIDAHQITYKGLFRGDSSQFAASRLLLNP